MGLLDDLKKLLDDTGEKASKGAGKAAAKQAWKATKAAVEGAGDDFLDAAQKELDEAHKAREGRTDYRPSENAADGVADDILEAARKADERRRSLGRERPQEVEEEGLIALAPEADPRARARAELERLKAELKARKEGAETPPKKTL